MPVFWLDPSDNRFPHPSEANPDGLLAIGGDLSAERLLSAYQLGIFPWYNPGELPLWWCPDPRFVLFPEQLKVSKSMRPYFNQQKFTVSYDTCFTEVVKACAKAPRQGQDGTWISNEIITGYTALHQKGFAHSVEVWEAGQLVGGLYGVALGKVFFGESMFARRSNASKFGFIALVRALRSRGFTLIDCQQETNHLRSLGAELISREAFLRLLGENEEKHPPAPAHWADWGQAERG